MNTSSSYESKGVDASLFLELFDKFLEEHKNDPKPKKSTSQHFCFAYTDDIDSQIKADEQILENSKERVVAGFLNLGKSDEWPEGNFAHVGPTFVSYILKKYSSQNKEKLEDYAHLLEDLFQTLRETGSMLSSPSFFQSDNKRGVPEKHRFVFDGKVTGWQDHAVTRIVGNLGSTYNPKNSLFEILINSQGSGESNLCRPFAISIHANIEVLDQRRRTLASYANAPQIIAKRIFYPDDLWKPGAFLEKYRDKMGPNSTRMLEGLSFLETVNLNAQTVGNCWMKQAMRSLLTGIYLELLTFETAKAAQEVWEEALKLYLDIQRIIAIPYVEELLKKCETTPQMYESAMKAIAYRKTL